MSQQEFFPSPQSSERGETGESEIQRPIPWSSKFKTGNVTKDEHPSGYEEDVVPPYSYPAQDRRSATRNQEEERPAPVNAPPRNSGATNNARQRFSPDGDAMEYGYRPYWRARSSRKHTVAWWIILVLLVILLVKLLPVLVAILLAVLGVGLFLILLPVLIVLGFVLIFGGLVLFILARLGFPVRRFLLRDWRRGGIGRRI